MSQTAILPPAIAAAPDLRPALLANRAATLARLYRRAFPVVRQYVLRHGGSGQDAQDVFQDALVVLYEKTVAGTLALTAEPGTYLAGVSRHLWQRERARRVRYPHAELAEMENHAPADEPEPLAPAAALGHLAQLSEKCRAVLLAFYYFGQPLAQIAAAHGFGSVRSATVQKFKCLERLRNAVRAALTTDN